MASARLIPKALYHSRRFLKLPVTAQNLMTFLILNADNDGIVEAYAIMSMINASDDDLRVLEERGLIYVLNEDWITYICQFQDFNHLDARNFQISKHRKLLVQVHPELESKLVIPQKRKRIKEIPWDSVESHGEEKGKEEKGKEEKGKEEKGKEKNKNRQKIYQSITKRIEYNYLVKEFDLLKNEILKNICDVMMDVYTGTSKTIAIGNNDYERQQVIERYDMIDASCVRYIVDSIIANQNTITNPCAYIMACLFNAPKTIDTHYITQI